MGWMTRGDWILLGIAGYIAVMALVRLMQRRRDQLVADVQRQIEARREQKQATSSKPGRKAA